MHYRLEIVDETRTVNQAVKHGWKVRKLMFIGVRGAPDRIFGRNGVAILIEFKRKGEEPGTQQLRRHAELRLHFGFTVYWTDNHEDACALLGIPPDGNKAYA